MTTRTDHTTVDTGSGPGLRPITSATFDEVLATASVPVVVDFGAAWCPPCGPMKAVLAEVAAAHPGALDAWQVDVDVEVDLARRFDVMSLPTLLVFVDGELVLRTVGARGRGRLLEDLAPYLDLR
jgi:thioredoxin 1